MKFIHNLAPSAVEILSTIISWQKIKKHLSVSFFTNAYFMVIHWVSAYLIGFFFWVLSARYYSAEDMGLASATIAALVFIK